MDVPGQWWPLFHSPELNALVDDGMKANPDIAAAQGGAAAIRSRNLVRACPSGFRRRCSATP
jgi:outer membrane protein TolC